MRILFVTQIVPYPPHGGVLQRGYNLLRELGKEHSVHLLAFHHPDELAEGAPLENGLHELRKFCREVEHFPLWPKRSAAHKLAAFAAGALYPRPFSVLAHRSKALADRIRAICSSESPPDIVHLDTIALAPYLELCGGVPTVLGHHNIESQLMARRADHEAGTLARWYVARQARLLVDFERQYASRFPLNITVSSADATTLEKICPGARTAVLPNGVDTDYFTRRPDTGMPSLIYTGGMNMFANRDAVEWFLQAIWPTVKKAIPGVRFYAVGARPSKAVLDMATQDPSIEAPGFVPDVRTWVARAAVYVVPLRVGGGTRLKMVDAMAQGKAIVSTTVGAEGIDGQDGVHFVLADTPDAIAAQVIRLLADSTARERLGTAARKRAEERYAWPMLGKQLAAHYSKVVGGARP
jgi:sugar transferase (PEP-CTERM/EpsH1 system associated)